ncbi:MAG: hypothetical protein WCP21_03280 [Armatimonadota bacterium]
MRWEAKVLLVGVFLVALMAISGCGGSNDQSVFQNVFDRATFSPTGTRLGFESIGGNGLFYTYSINSSGGNLTLLTPTDSDTDLTDEGGKMPSWSPVEANNEMVIVARRGTGGQALFLINPTTVLANPVLALTDDSVAGADSQPSWAPLGGQVIYVSNKGTDHFIIRTVNRDGTATGFSYDPAVLGLPLRDAQWPVFSPDGTKIAFQLGESALENDTSIVVMNADGTGAVVLGGANGFRDEAPNFITDSNTLLFHSNRFGDFDILKMSAVDGSGLVRLTSDSRSDGFPVWNAATDQIAFTRDRSLWRMSADGVTQVQLTQRF